MAKSNNFRMSKLVEKYYRSWIDGTKHFGHPNDEERFYKFVKACLRYGKKRKNGVWLKYFLEQDLKNKYTDDYLNEIIEKAITIFDHLVDFYYSEFPDHLIEMRNPYLVRSQLERIIDQNKKKYFSKSYIDDFIKKHF